MRVSGPFTVEAVPGPVVKPLAEIETEPVADDSLARSGETLRQAQWRDELLKTGIRTKGGRRLEFARLKALPGTRFPFFDPRRLQDYTPSENETQRLLSLL